MKLRTLHKRVQCNRQEFLLPYKLFLTLTALISSTLSSVANSAALLAPPPYEVKNRHGVNMQSAEVSPSQMDISIGGAMGLSHTISSYTSNFVNWDEASGGTAPTGYKEPFSGGLFLTPFSFANKQVIRVFTDSASADFYPNANNTYVPKVDSGYTLQYVNNPTDTSKYHESVINFSKNYVDENGVSGAGFSGFVFSDSSGNIAYFPKKGGSNLGGDRLIMSYIQRPNGLLIRTKLRDSAVIAGAVGSVTTNTGFQLKYLHQYNTVEAPAIAGLPASDARTWSHLLPKYLLAINNAVDPCSTDDNTIIYSINPIVSNEGESTGQVIQKACSGLTKKWPMVTYTWPNGMPLAMYGYDKFKVTDAMGQVTEYVHTGIDTKSYPGYLYKKVTRLSQIIKNGKVMMNYQFDTHDLSPGAVNLADGSSSFNFNPGAAARLIRSWVQSDVMGYAPGGLGNPAEGKFGNQGDGYQAITHAFSSKDGMYNMQSWNMAIDLEFGPSNRVLKVQKHGADTVELEYDESIPQDPVDPSYTSTARSRNVFKSKAVGTNGSVLTTTATGYQKCTLANYKICNKATQITDPKGNVTDYVYDLLSGEPAKVTLPPGENGIRPETRYSYAPHYAYYKQNGESTLSKAKLPVYLLVRESKCQKTAASGAGCNGGIADEIVTEYDYGPQDGRANNLFLRGIKVTATGSKGRETRNTCYTYDDYGNRISETKPKANLSACY